MNELQPCPFCGGEVAYDHYAVSGEGRIKCSTCQTALVFLDTDKPPKEEVVQCWNNRQGDMESLSHELNLIKSECSQWTRDYKTLEQAQIELQKEILSLNQIRSNLNNTLSTYMDKDDQLDEIESIWALRKEESEKIPTVSVITLKIQVGHEEHTFRCQHGEAEMIIKTPCPMLESLNLSSLLAGVLSAALADYDADDIES